MIEVWLLQNITLGNVIVLITIIFGIGKAANRLSTLEKNIVDWKNDSEEKFKQLKAESEARLKDIETELESVNVKQEASMFHIAETYQRKDVQEATLRSIDGQLTDIRRTLDRLESRK